MEIKTPNIMTIEEPKVSEERLLEAINNFIDTKRNRYLTSLVIEKALNSETEYKNFTKKELFWLSKYIEVINRVSNSAVGSTIFHIFNDRKGETVAEISRLTGNYTSVVRHWVKKFHKVGLVGCSNTLIGSGNRVYYGINSHALPNIIDLINEKIADKHPKDKLKKLSSVHEDIQYKAILRSRYGKY